MAINLFNVENEMERVQKEKELLDAIAASWKAICKKYGDILTYKKVERMDTLPNYDAVRMQCLIKILKMNKEDVYVTQEIEWEAVSQTSQLVGPYLEGTLDEAVEKVFKIEWANIYIREIFDGGNFSLLELAGFDISECDTPATVSYDDSTSFIGTLISFKQEDDNDGALDLGETGYNVHLYKKEGEDQEDIIWAKVSFKAKGFVSVVLSYSLSERSIGSPEEAINFIYLVIEDAQSYAIQHYFDKFCNLLDKD